MVVVLSNTDPYPRLNMRFELEFGKNCVMTNDRFVHFPCPLHALLILLLPPPHPLCPGNFSRLRKLAKLFPFSKLCLKLYVAGAG